MKILEIIPSLSSGGAERLVVDLCNQMAIDGHEVTLLTMKDYNLENHGFYKDELNEKVKTINLSLGKFNIGTFVKVYKAIKTIKCDVVHMHLSSSFFCLLALLFDRKKKYVATCHNQAENEKKNEGFRFYVKNICIRFHLFDQVSISDQNEKSIKKIYAAPAIKLIYNGRAAMKVTNSYSDVQKEICGYKKTEDTKVFIIIAKFKAQKNIPRLVRCFNKLIEDGEDVILLVVGSGYDSPSIQPVLQQANERIHILGPRHNVADYLSCSDFFTLSSDYEGMPITLIEAFACGCIPVGTPVSGFNDVVEDGVNGFVANGFNDESYIETLKRAIANQNTISKQTLKDLYMKKLSMELCAKQYEDLFRDLVSKWRKGDRSLSRMACNIAHDLKNQN